MKQRHVAALLAEALGTFVLVLVVLNVSRYGLPFFTAIAAGLSVAAFTSAFAHLSGANFNPAFTLGLFSIRRLSFVRTVAYLVAQAVAALGAWKLYEYFTERTLKNATTPFDWRIFTAEAVGALVFALGATVAVVHEKLEGWQAAATVGVSLFLGITVAGLASNGIVNPAVALGVRSFDLNYFLGPVVGFIVGALLVAYVLYPVFGKKEKVAAAAKVVEAPKASVATKSAPAKKPVAKKAPAKKKPVAKKAKK
jgi:glycerol uptake facilitator-like aquaporin